MKATVARKKQWPHLIVALIVMLLGAVVCSASPITYDVNRTIGIGSVTGFIETDGTTGVLGAGDFVDWSLLLNDGTNTYNLYGPLSGSNSSVYVQGSDVTASATQLLFNFSGTDNGYFLFQYGVGIHDGYHYYCDATFSGICLAGETVAPAYYTQGQTASRSGNVVIGTVASTVPEPGTYSLMLTGLGLLMRKRRALGSILSNRKQS
jgi:PEP-CTERM motif